MGKRQEPGDGMVPTIPLRSAAASVSLGPTLSPAPPPTTPPAAPLADLRSRELVRRLELSGFASTEAGNIVAYAQGLRPVASGWRVAEIEHLRFLRALVADGRLAS